tara:strand:- start:13543 stop:14112 length:570 start_codon:yes stop_codon:yes gene_type:complete
MKMPSYRPYAAICVHVGVWDALISVNPEVCESSIRSQINTLLTKPAADTPSTEKLKLICTDPIALAAETPDGERIEFVINVGLPTALATDTPVTLKVTPVPSTIVALPTALAADTPVTLTFDTPVAVAVPIALAADTPVTLTDTGRLIVTEPTALAAETPVTSTGSGLFQDPEFQVLLSQPVIRAIKKS